MPAGIVAEVSMHMSDKCQKPPRDTHGALSGAPVKVFAVNSPQFVALYGKPQLPQRMFGQVFTSGPACNSGVTDSQGKISLGVPKVSSYLMIVKYTDPDSNRTVYTGKYVRTHQFRKDINHDGLKDTAEINMHIEKIKKCGNWTNAPIDWEVEPEEETDWYMNQAQIKLTPSDNLSGVAATYYGVYDDDTTVVPSNEGTTFVINTEGIHYVKFYSRDVAGNEEEIKEVVVKIDKDPDGDGVYNQDDLMPNTWGYAEYQGCPCGIVSTVELNTTDSSGQRTVVTKAPLADVSVKVFAVNSSEFTSYFGSSNVPSSRYFEVYQYGPEFNSGYTNPIGTCALGVPGRDKYLEIARYSDAQAGKTVYAGRNIERGDFKDSIDRDRVKDTANAKFQIMKTITKDKKTGTINVSIQAGQSLILNGSYLEVIYPDFNVYEINPDYYPVIMSSDSEWQVDMTVSAPEGYAIVGDAHIVDTVNNETKAYIFELQDFQSPDPNLQVVLKTLHHGKTKNVSFTMSEKKKAVMDQIIKKADEKHTAWVKASASKASNASASLKHRSFWQRIWDGIVGIFGSKRTSASLSLCSW